MLKSNLKNNFLKIKKIILIYLNIKNILKNNIKPLARLDDFHRWWLVVIHMLNEIHEYIATKAAYTGRCGRLTSSRSEAKSIFEQN